MFSLLILAMYTLRSVYTKLPLIPLSVPYGENLLYWVKCINIVYGNDINFKKNLPTYHIWPKLKECDFYSVIPSQKVTKFGLLFSKRGIMSH